MNRNDIKVPEIKTLDWHNERPRFDGKINGSVAEDDVWIKDRERMYIRYDVRRGASKETDDQWHILIQFPSKIIQENVESFEAGKIICAHYRKLFWEEFYRKMMETIFE